MKKILHTNRNFFRHLVLVFLTGSVFSANAQVVNEMSFENATLEPGSVAGTANGAVYRFPQVNSQMDALLTITGRSSSLVVVSNLDMPSQGFTKAFQPQIKYNNGNVPTATSWWIEFQIRFVNQGTNLPAQISEFHVTGLDIDGNGSRLKEWDAFYGGNSYTMETNSQLSVTNLVGTINQPALGGKQFTGTLDNHNNIDTSATDIMTSVKYTNSSSMTIRMGATTTGSTSNANRMYSVWFKNFSYTAPISTLPVKLTAFTASLAKEKVSLKWETAAEINVSHFELERSTDGVNFSQAALVFAYGSAASCASYSYTDNIAAFQQPVVYYRLRSVDIDGKSELSETRIIRLSKEEANILSLLTYPNPVVNDLRVTLPAGWQNKQVVIEVFGANGHVAQRKTTGGANQTENINVNALSPGLYIVKATCAGQSIQQKIVKQ